MSNTYATKERYRELQDEIEILSEAISLVSWESKLGSSEALKELTIEHIKKTALLKAIRNKLTFG